MQAAATKHAIVQYISNKSDDDPVYYQKLSARLEEIIQKYHDNWEE